MITIKFNLFGDARDTLAYWDMLFSIGERWENGNPLGLTWENAVKL